MDEQAKIEAAQARLICRTWVGRLGWGFHPDNRGSDYSPALSVLNAAEYDRDMDALFSLPTIGDPYAFAVEAMENQESRDVL